MKWKANKKENEQYVHGFEYNLQFNLRLRENDTSST